MHIQNLNGIWKMTPLNRGNYINLTIPGSVYSGYLENNMMPDPFYADNEIAANKLLDTGYRFVTHFSVDENVVKMKKLVLKFECIDTVGKVYLNDVFLGTCENMHRTYLYDVKGILKEGMNSLRVDIESPNEYIREKHNKKHLWSAECSQTGFSHIRKAHYMFGWDWGPTLPDAGIHRDVWLIGYNYVAIDSVYFTQKFYSWREHNFAQIDADIELDIITEGNYFVKMEAKAPDGKVFETDLVKYDKNSPVGLRIDEPMLWWPNGYGEQNLYDVKVVLYRDDVFMDEKNYRLGLRELTVSRTPDRWGEEFCFKVNGVKIFAMGANYIPQDNVLQRINYENTKRLLKDCADANFNCIRIWGGGYYENDYFYDICDELGLIVWQDFMFACAVYDLTEEFEANIRQEAIDNIKRLRHHACIGLWCGNNEMEFGFVTWERVPKDEKTRLDYLRMYEGVIKDTVEKYDPNRFYWPSSPSSGGGFLHPESDDYGDVHYWDVWHANAPIEDVTKHYFRFCSEFGMEAWPDMKTLATIADEKDMNVFSYVMDSHQKCKSGNGKMLMYLSANYKMPSSMEMTVYATQLMQADAITMAVEHFRRNRGRCMGSIYWQINDCWPAPSWASIDYYGRFKALHYAARHFYAPVMICATADSYDTDKITITVSNETMNDFEGEVEYAVKNSRFKTLKKGSLKVKADKLSSIDVTCLDVSEFTKEKEVLFNTYMEYTLKQNGKIIRRHSKLFTKQKYFEFLKPRFTFDVKEENDKYVINVKSNVYAKSVKLEIKDSDCRFSDNYFDITSKEGVSVTVDKNEFESAEQIMKGISAISVYNI